MNVLPLIKTRRAVRKFKKGSIPAPLLRKILEAGRWAPSGLNNQPWRFMVLGTSQKDAVALYTGYSDIVKSSDKVILVFLDKKESYNYEKDLLAVGACIQNMLLYAHSVKLGACWLGEILNRRDEVCKYLNIPKTLQLEAVVALGQPVVQARSGKRKALRRLIIHTHR